MARRETSPESKDIGVRMQKIIKDLGLNQTQAAFRMGLTSQATLNNYLIGKREIPIAIMKKFCEVFNIKFSVLAGEEEPQGISAEVNDELVKTIMKNLDEWLAENKLTMTAAEKSRIFAHLYQSNCNQSEVIKGILSSLLSLKPEIFSKTK